MRDTLEHQQRQLVGIDEARPARRRARVSSMSKEHDLREELRGVDAALRALAEGDNQVGTVVGEERRAFHPRPHQRHASRH